jgi:hypothetical protein
MKDTPIRIVSGLLGLAAAVLALWMGVIAIKGIISGLSYIVFVCLLSGFGAYMLLQRAFRGANGPDS